MPDGSISASEQTFSEVFQEFERVYDDADNRGGPMPHRLFAQYYARMLYALGSSHAAYAPFAKAVIEAVRLEVPTPVFAVIAMLKL